MTERKIPEEIARALVKFEEDVARGLRPAVHIFPQAQIDAADDPRWGLPGEASCVFCETCGDCTTCGFCDCDWGVLAP